MDDLSARQLPEDPSPENITTREYTRNCALYNDCETLKLFIGKLEEEPKNLLYQDSWLLDYLLRSVLSDEEEDSKFSDDVFSSTSSDEDKNTTSTDEYMKMMTENESSTRYFEQTTQTRRLEGREMQKEYKELKKKLIELLKQLTEGEQLTSLELKKKLIELLKKLEGEQLKSLELERGKQVKQPEEKVTQEELKSLEMWGASPPIKDVPDEKEHEDLETEFSQTSPDSGEHEEDSDIEGPGVIDKLSNEKIHGNLSKDKEGGGKVTESDSGFASQDTKGIENERDAGGSDSFC